MPGKVNLVVGFKCGISLKRAKLVVERSRLQIVNVNDNLWKGRDLHVLVLLVDIAEVSLKEVTKKLWLLSGIDFVEDPPQGRLIQ